MFKSLTLAVIIPAYNEEHHIEQCLLAISRQEQPFDEVILVDNNCTDDTVKIARAFPFVRIIKEKKQGLIPARNAGFNSAKSDILCRIDADAVLAPDWSSRVRKNFEEDDTLSGITGLAVTHLLPRIPIFHTTLYSRGYYWWTWYLFHAQVLWGAHMAITKDAWQSVRSIVCGNDGLVHEDQDLSLSLMSQGRHIRCDDKLLIRTNGQTYHYAPKLISYIQRAIATKHLHEKAGRFPLPSEVRVAKSKIIFATIMVFTGGMFFLIVSLTLWPIDKMMVLLGREKKWLD